MPGEKKCAYAHGMFPQFAEYLASRSVLFDMRLVDASARSLVALCILLLLIPGCARFSAPTRGPDSFSSEFHREHSLEFTKDQQTLIAAARAHMQQTEKKPADVYYRVRPTAQGHEVFILYVTGYEGNLPVFRPCNDVAVLLDPDGNVHAVLTGPAAWP